MKYDSVYISPHIDDAVFSCGGSVAKQIAQDKRVLVVSLFTKGLDCRIAEEREVSERAGYDVSLLDFRDAPVRSLRYRLNVRAGSLKRDEKVYASLVDDVGTLLSSIEYDRCYVPLAVGGHVDHLLAHRACRQVVPSRKRVYYEELPYCLMSHQVASRLDGIGCGIALRRPIHREWVDAYRHVMGRPRYGGSMCRKVAWAIPVMGAMFYHVINLRAQDGGGGRAEQLLPLMEDVSETFEAKLELSKCYHSQWRLFFRDDAHYRNLAKQYMESIEAPPSTFLERYWLPRDDEL